MSSRFSHVFLKYFENRLSFFKFSLPMLMLIYPFVPSLVPLYFLPKYLPLHLIYIFLIVSNLRILKDLFDRQMAPEFKTTLKQIYLLSTVLLLGHSFMFSYLERGHFISSLSVDWRSIFYLLSTFSILSIWWIWYFLLRDMIKCQLLKSLIPCFKYPLFLVPPLMLNLHSGQIPLTLTFMGILLCHALVFECLSKDMSAPSWLIRLFVFCLVLLSAWAWWLMETGILPLAVLFLLGAIFIIFVKKLRPEHTFVISLIAGWGSLILVFI